MPPGSNQAEVWFSILAAKALAGAGFTSPRQVRDQIDAFVKTYNQTAHPFEWTKQVRILAPRAKEPLQKPAAMIVV